MSASKPLSPSAYLHGTHPEEQQRLSKLNDLLNQKSLAELQLQGGECILDVGCGLSQLTYIMARQADSDGQVIGIESNSAQIEEALRQAKDRDEEDLVELRLGSAYNMPLRGNEWGSFDVVHTRFLLEHLQKPSIVVQEMVKAARSGGRIILEDDDHDLLRFYPEPPGVQALWDAYMRTYDRLGNDPYIGRRLVWLLHQAGARPVRNTWLFFGSCSGEPNFDTVIDNMIGIVGGAREIMINDGLIDPQTFDEGIESLHNWKQRRDAAMWFGFAWAEGVKP